MTEQHPRFSLRPGLTDLLVLLVLFAPAFLKFGRFADDPGVGWHLRTGEWILANGGAPTVDPFLAGAARPWVSDQWLSDVLFWLIYDIGGWSALYAALTGVFLFLYFGPVLRTASAASGAHVAAAVAAVCGLKLATIHFILRPVMLGFLCFAVVFAICSRVATRVTDDPVGARSGMLRLLFALPPIFLLWANLHPSFILGFILVGTLALAFVLQPFFFGDEPTGYNRAAANVVGVLVLCFVATLLNPYGFELHRSIVELAGSEFFARFNAEWHSPDFLEGSSQIALLCFVFIIGVRYLSDGARMRLFEFGALVAFTIGYLRSVRLLPFLSIALAVPLAHAIRDVGRLDFVERLEVLAPVRRAAERMEEWEARSSRGAIGLVVAGVVLAAGWMPIDSFGPSQRYPHAALAYLKDLPDDSVVYASPNFGGFITWVGEGKVRAVVDDRNTMLGEDIYRDRQSVVMLKDAGWVETVQKTGATHILAPLDSPLNYAARRELKVAHEDEGFVVYEVAGTRPPPT